MSRVIDAIQKGSHMRLLEKMKSTGMEGYNCAQAYRHLNLKRCTQIEISALVSEALAEVKRRKFMSEVEWGDIATKEESFTDLIQDDGSLTVGDLFPLMRKTKFKSKYNYL